MKKALVKSLVKKTLLDPSGYKNYWPIFNLGILFKVIERVMAAQLKSYLSANSFGAEIQFAYTAETALLKVVIDICLAIGQNQV